MIYINKTGTEADGRSYVEAGATFSQCEQYRYLLWRTWRHGPHAMFLMLNPSTATHLVLDPTLRRCRAYAEEWGYSGFVVANLFAFRATAPKDMKASRDPIGEGNDDILLARADHVIKLGGVIVAGWGTHGEYMNRCYDVKASFRKRALALHYLKLTKDGHPGHPLYLPEVLRPQPWSWV